MLFGKNKVHVLSLGLALGVICGVYVLFVGIVAWKFQWGLSLANLMSEWYIGFSASLLGSLIGALWGFVDGFIGGVLIAWLYNVFYERIK